MFERSYRHEDRDLVLDSIVDAIQDALPDGMPTKMAIKALCCALSSVILSSLETASVDPQPRQLLDFSMNTMGKVHEITLQTIVKEVVICQA